MRGLGVLVVILCLSAPIPAQAGWLRKLAHAAEHAEIRRMEVGAAKLAEKGSEDAAHIAVDGSAKLATVNATGAKIDTKVGGPLFQGSASATGLSTEANGVKVANNIGLGGGAGEVAPAASKPGTSVLEIVAMLAVAGGVLAYGFFWVRKQFRLLMALVRWLKSKTAAAS